MDFPRASGVLLHPTSFPGRFGIGELGSEAYRFVDFLARAGQRLWQVMPLGPTGYGDSPYASPSAFAGNPMLVSLERLQQEGLLEEDDVATMPPLPEDRIDFGAVIPVKMGLLRRAFERWRDGRASNEQREQFQAFVEEHRFWLEDYALYMALQETYSGQWNSWPDDLVVRRPEALEQARRELADLIDFRCFLQYQFFRQWLDLKRYANERNILIIGDIPIFVAYDSADVWSNPGLFYLDEERNPTVVAGVPPDYFSATGQLWGNPLYRWDTMARDDYRWWAERFRQTFRLVDIVRIDHFRGFESYWEVPAGEETAINGRWLKGPGLAFFKAIERQLGALPIIAEDLGIITEEVNVLRQAAGFPGMRVLQFAWVTDATNPYLPHNYVRDTVVYTGTHDNDTTIGWFQNISQEEREKVLRYLGHGHIAIHWELIRLAMMSVANFAIFPLQDALGLGSEARMNIPGQQIGNWGWRYRASMLTDELAGALAEMATTYGRVPAKQDHA
ncbi:MAG: 4-alpha-glucanotransferase [Herpetosiphonaceae bacterium]|nr:MAG: 4-alpha-glucanotransferase [Herpetosiphonaceae bacterium]